MRKKAFRSFISLLLAVMLVVCMCFTAFSVYATTTSDGTKVVYLKPSANWQQANARFAVYLFSDGNDTAWADMNDEDGDGAAHKILCK